MTTTPRKLEVGSGETGLAMILISLSAPIAASIMIQFTDVRFVSLIAIFLSLSASIQAGHKAVSQRNTGRYAFLTDALLHMTLAILSAVYLTMATNTEETKLYRLGLDGYQGIKDTFPSYLILLWVVSIAASPLTGIGTKISAASTSAKFEVRTATTLALLGIIGLGASLTVSRVDAFATRGEASGNGLWSLLYWSAAAFIVYVFTTWRSGDNRALLGASIALSVLIGLVGNRSPLAVIAVALLYRVVQDRRKRLLATGALAVPVILVIFAYQSTWRSLVANGAPASVTDVFLRMMADPSQQFLRLGLDTTDGLTLATKILQNGFAPRWADPLMSIFNFVPRQLWPSKPELLGTEVGLEYLGTTAGGIFLSGPGYFALVTGSLVVGSAVFIVVIAIIKRIISLNSLHPVVRATLLLLAVRLTVAGDSFDIFLAIQMIALLGAGTLLGRVFFWIR